MTMGGTGYAAVQRMLRVFEASEATGMTGVAGTIQPTIDVTPFVAEFDMTWALGQDPGSTGVVIATTVPVGEIWRVYAVSIEEETSTCTFDKLFLRGESSNLPLVIQTAATSLLYESETGLFLPSTWSLAFNVASYSTGRYDFRAAIARFALLTPAVLPA